MCKTCRRTVKDSAQNALKVAVFGCKIEKFSGEGAQRPPQWGGGHPLPTLHPTRRLRRLDSRAYGASTNPLDPPDGARPLQILLARTAPESHTEVRFHRRDGNDVNRQFVNLNMLTTIVQSLVVAMYRRSA